MPALELWGGYECTVNRVGNSWFDQTHLSGHQTRIGDLQLFADLGMTSLRYPALWERISPDNPQVQDFAWTDERLPEIRRLGMNPIVTLCHHGSGLHYTSLVDDSFAPGLDRHAAAVAERYPWVRDWTPVNEPLTTARFSALYGYWYPHTQDEGLFWTALLNEIDATRLSMRAIRKVNPEARLIQTDDLGYCHATQPLQCEADYQNQRRWIGWDLLCGMVVPGHALWERLVSHGLADRLRAIADDPCPPDIIGVNHYLASERLLDHRVELHPDRAVADRELGECGGAPFVDVDAIRSWRAGVLGLPTLIEQAWERYGIPVAVTECHNGASREEQVRWFVEVWNAMEALRDRGIDVRSVTAWSLLGSHDWNRMVTRFIGHYETGVFDCRSGKPRPTLLAHVLKDLASGRAPGAPFLDVPGWWRRELRFMDAEPAGPEFERAPALRLEATDPPLVIVGAGPLAQLAVQSCERRGLPYVRSHDGTPELLDLVRPWAVLDARDHDDLCGYGTPENGNCAVVDLIDVCTERQLRCAVLTRHLPEKETAEVRATPGLLVVQTHALFLPHDEKALPVQMLRALDEGRPVQADGGSVWRQAYAPEVIDGALDLLLDGVEGAVAFVSSEPWSEACFASALARTADRDLGLIQATPVAAIEGSGVVTFLPPGESTLERFVRECRAAIRSNMLNVAEEAGWAEAAE